MAQEPAQGRVDLTEPAALPAGSAGSFVKTVQRLPVRLRLFGPAWRYLVIGESAEVTFWLDGRKPPGLSGTHWHPKPRKTLPESTHKPPVSEGPAARGTVSLPKPPGADDYAPTLPAR